MSLEKYKFWVTCPACQQKFGVKAETVCKYMDRLFGQLQERTVKQGQRFQARRTPEPPANLPVAEK